MFREVAKATIGKSCVDCKHFFPNKLYINPREQFEKGYCKLYSFLSRGSAEPNYYYAQSSRFRPDICGPEAKAFVEKYSK
jgi:hypothetical protein